MPIKIDQIKSGEALRSEQLADAKLTAIKEVAEIIEGKADEITGPVPRVERDSWGPKAAEARAILAGGAAGPILAAESSATGETLQDLAQKVLDNASQFEPLIGALTALRREASGAIGVAEDPASVFAAVDLLRSKLAAL